ncbi:MAG: DUF4145 domain-containing protein [Xanthomonadales bacterium]|nr:DUF4145 domain-containing protein [Xanthomonadales bacterium]
MLVDCSSCKAKVDGVLIGQHDDQEFFATRTFLLSCPACNSALIAQSYEDLDTDPPGWSAPVRVFPAPTRKLGSDIPSVVKASIEEAEKCMQSGAYLASTAMCGRALEAICRHYKTKDNYLGGGLKELRDTSVIDARLYQWGEELREQRNNAAHATSAVVSTQDANDVLAFTYAIIDYVFLLAQKFEKFQKRKSLRSAAARKSAGS